MTEKKIRLCLADDQPLLRSAIARLINGEDDMEVCGQASNGAEAVECVKASSPDILLLDIRMPIVDGINVVRMLRADPTFASMRILMLTMYDDERLVRQCLRLGADGYILKDAEPERMLAAIRSVIHGSIPLSPTIARTVINQWVASPSWNSDDDLASPLTPREREVLILVAKGYSNEAIQNELVISHGTVKSHIRALLRKTGARDRAQLVVFAFRAGLAS
ncbi:MAG: response regulator transcription factor [Actinomycetaceae bacterium]|nr:response regulator transcription factor [Actinomycetaceae bacterium]